MRGTAATSCVRHSLLRQKRSPRMASLPIRLLHALGASALIACAAATARAEISAAQAQEIIEQNRRLQEQVRAQQKTIETLSAQVGEALRASERHERELVDLRDRAPDQGSSSGSSGNRDQEIRISGETGIAFFRTEAAGQYPN